MAKISLYKKVDYSMFHWGVTIPMDMKIDFYKGKKNQTRLSKKHSDNLG